MAKNEAVAYLRTSSATNVDGDSSDRQRDAIARWAKRTKVKVVEEFCDEAVSGKLGLAERPGLSALLERILANGVRIVVIETASRLARDLVEGELILRELRRHDIQVIEAEGGNDLTAGDGGDPTTKLIRQVLGAVAEFERDVLVAKLRVARDRKRKAEGRCEGDKPFGEQAGEAESLEQLKKLARKRGGKRPSTADIATAANEAGLRTRRGGPWSKQSVHKILTRAGLSWS